MIVRAVRKQIKPKKYRLRGRGERGERREEREGAQFDFDNKQTQ